MSGKTAGCSRSVCLSGWLAAAQRQKTLCNDVWSPSRCWCEWINTSRLDLSFKCFLGSKQSLCNSFTPQLKLIDSLIKINEITTLKVNIQIWGESLKIIWIDCAPTLKFIHQFICTFMQINCQRKLLKAFSIIFYQVGASNCLQGTQEVLKPQDCRLLNAAFKVINSSPSSWFLITDKMQHANYLLAPRGWRAANWH